MGFVTAIVWIVWSVIVKFSSETSEGVPSNASLILNLQRDELTSGTGSQMKCPSLGVLFIIKSQVAPPLVEYSIFAF